MRIVVVGAGKLGYSIAELLSHEQFDIVVVDHDEERLEVVRNTLDVVRVSRIEYGGLMEKVGVDIVLSTRLLSAGEVLAFARGGVVSVSLLEGAKAEAVEVIVQEGAPVIGQRLMDLSLPKECLICAYVRGGEAYIPNGQSVLMEGDRIILFSQTEHSQKVMQYFKGRE